MQLFGCLIAENGSQKPVPQLAVHTGMNSSHALGSGREAARGRRRLTGWWHEKLMWSVKLSFRIFKILLVLYRQAFMSPHEGVGDPCFWLTGFLRSLPLMLYRKRKRKKWSFPRLIFSAWRDLVLTETLESLLAVAIVLSNSDRTLIIRWDIF